MFFRLIGGLSVGASSVTAAMYISEISPASKRGQLTALFQLNIVIGILIAYLSNYSIGGASDGNWRFMLGIESIPAALFVFMIFFVPRSPRWLILKKGKIDEARQVLREIDPKTVEENIIQIQSSIFENNTSGSFKEFLSGKFNFSILLAFLIAFFNQWSVVYNTMRYR